MPIPVESLYEIGFVVLGRRSIFLISIILALGSYGLIMIYFIVFGDTFSSIVRNICYPDLALDQNNIFTSRLFYVVTLGLALTPVILRKEMKELKCVSITLFLSIGLFMLIFTLQLLQGKTVNPDVEHKYFSLIWDRELVTSFSIVLTAYTFQMNLFPTYNSLTVKNEKVGLQAVSQSLVISFAIYIALSVLSIYMFGSTVNQNVLNNVVEMKSLASFIIRISFLIVLACHIPYVYFSGKESLLIMIDEVRFNSMSKPLQLKLESGFELVTTRQG